MPSSPGVYIFVDQKSTPLYIGKSISLKDRIKQHLEASTQLGSKAAYYVGQSTGILYQTVQNDLQAIILEANLIKIHQPKYNSLSKDDRSLIYITIQNFPHPRIDLVHATDLILKDYDHPTAQVFGPYLNKKTATELLKLIRNIFGYCQNPFNAKLRKCFNRHINLCPGACDQTLTPAQYYRHLLRISRFLSGQFLKLQLSITQEINKASRRQDYDKAKQLKNQYDLVTSALTSTSYKWFLNFSAGSAQTISLLYRQLQHPLLDHPPARIECYDAAHLQGHSYVAAMTVLTQGEVDTNSYRLFKIKSAVKSDQHALKHVLTRRFHHADWPTPDLVVIDGGVSQLTTTEIAIPAHIATIGLSKSHETIHFKGSDGKYRSLNWPPNNPALNMLMLVRDEAHRKAHGFYQKSHRRSILKKNQ